MNNSNENEKENHMTFKDKLKMFQDKTKNNEKKEEKINFKPSYYLKTENNLKIEEANTKNNEIIEQKENNKKNINIDQDNIKEKNDSKIKSSDFQDKLNFIQQKMIFQNDKNNDNNDLNKETIENENLGKDMNDNINNGTKDETISIEENKKNKNIEINTEIVNNCIEKDLYEKEQNENKEKISMLEQAGTKEKIEEEKNEDEVKEKTEKKLNKKEDYENIDRFLDVNIEEKVEINKNDISKKEPKKEQKEDEIKIESNIKENNNNTIISSKTNKENDNNIKSEFTNTNNININKENSGNSIKRRIAEMQKLYKNKKEEPKEQHIFKKFDASFLERIKIFRAPKEKKEKVKYHKENNIINKKNNTNSNEKEIIKGKNDQNIDSENTKELNLNKIEETEKEDKKEEIIRDKDKEKEEDKIIENENFNMNEEKKKEENINYKKDDIEESNKEENNNYNKNWNINNIEDNGKINENYKNEKEVENNTKDKTKNKNFNKFQMITNSLNEKILGRKKSLENNEFSKGNEEKSEGKEKIININNENNDNNKENNLNNIDKKTKENDDNSVNNLSYLNNIDNEAKENNKENEYNINNNTDEPQENNDLKNEGKIKNENIIEDDKKLKQDNDNIIDNNESNNRIENDILIGNDERDNKIDKNNLIENENNIKEDNNRKVNTNDNKNKEKNIFDFEINDGDEDNIENESDKNKKRKNSFDGKALLFQKTTGFNDLNLNPVYNSSSDINDVNGSYLRERKSTMFNIQSFTNKISLDKPETRIEDIFLDKINISQDEPAKNDTFCECFFLSSFSKENGKLMEKSEDNKAECGHFLCSYLPAMQPEIIYKYPKDDIKGLEINCLAASICFTNGIKVCYEEKEDTIKTVKNYRSSFTNQVGDRFFAVAYHFYLKMLNSDFENLYTVTPIKNKLSNYEDELNALFSEELPGEVLNKLNIYEKMNMKENVYIPFCLCLVSRYPFIEPMEKCLESIMMSINNIDQNNIDELNKVITYIVKSIPTPPKHSKVYFPLPYFNKFVDIEYPYYRDINEFCDNPLIILYYLSPSNILCLFKLLIFEQKILIVGKDNDDIAKVILNFASLLYPFDWIHTYIPIMSEKMVKFLQSFLPFFTGINITLLNRAKLILEKASKEVFIINIDEDKIELNDNYQNNKPIKASSYIKKNFQSLPKNVENLILKELKDIKTNHIKAKDDYDKYNANLKIKNLFFYVFVELLQDYKKYSYVIDDYPVFNSVLMIKEKKSDKKFFKDFTSTQIFQMFIQKSLFKDKDKRTFFDELFDKFTDLKKNKNSSNNIYKKLYNYFKNDYNEYFKIKKNYIIRPFFIKEFKEYEEQFKKKNKKMKLSNITLFLSKQYEQQKDNNINDHGVLRENRRIIKNPIYLTNDKDPKIYNIFLIPTKKLNYNIDEETIMETDDIPKKTLSNRFKFISDENGDNNNEIRMKRITSNDKELTEDDLDDIKENIREIMSRIYKSDVRKIEKDKAKLMEYLMSYYGIYYFASILNTGNIEKRAVKIVIEESYDFFSYVIFNTLLNILKLEENSQNYKIAVKLLKVCLCIKTVKNKKEIFLSDDLFSKFEDYAYFNNLNFWKIWIEDDLTKSDIEELKKYKSNTYENEYIYIDEEDENYKLYLKHSYIIIEELLFTMIKMKFQKSFVMLKITDLIKEFIIDENDVSKLMNRIIEALEIYKNK